MIIGKETYLSSGPQASHMHDPALAITMYYHFTTHRSIGVAGTLLINAVSDVIQK